MLEVVSNVFLSSLVVMFFFLGPQGLVTYTLLIENEKEIFVILSAFCVKLPSAELLSFTIVIVVFPSFSFSLLFFFLSSLSFFFLFFSTSSEGRWSLPRRLTFPVILLLQP